MPSVANRWMVGMSLPVLAATQARGEDYASFFHETYAEDHGRMTVNTETFRAQWTPIPSLAITAHGVYDAISGATPTGAPAINQLTMRQPITHAPVPNSAITGYTRLIDGITSASRVSSEVSRTDIPLAESRDIRRGGDIAVGYTFGPHRLTPQISYSQENDYISWAGALNYSFEFNDKNTVLNAGWSHAYDQILATNFSFLDGREIKSTDEFIVGVTQLLSPQTVVSINDTIGHAGGYLNDPYRSVVFNDSPLDPNGQVVLAGEKRPSTRDSQAVLLTVTQAVERLNASVEGSYRFYHDSYGIIANTVGVQWLQKIGHVAVVSPSFRYYRQGAAHFYGIQFPGSPDFDAAHVPTYYSSDYRLSFLETFTLGIEATVHLGEHFDLAMGYQRYWMRGLDHETLQSTYPRANIYTIGLTYTL
jgi:hypothetical protein